MKGLPKLSGTWLHLYRLVWLIALLVAFAAVAADQYHSLAPGRLIHAALLVSAATLLFRRRRTDPVAALLSFAFLLWPITRALAWPPASEGGVAIALLDKMRFALFVSAMLLFPSGRFDPRWTLHAVATAYGVALFGMAAALGLASLGLYTGLSIACAAIAVYSLRARFRGLAPGVQRQQIKWVGLGLAAGLALVVFSRLMTLAGQTMNWAEQMQGSASAYAFDAGVIVMALGILAALLRFRLYDADAAISRSSVYAALTVALLAIFAASETVIQTLSQNWFGGDAGAVSGALAAALAAALLAPLHARVSIWAEAHFQNGLAALRRDLPIVLADLRETAGLTRLAEAVLEQIEPAVRASRGAVLLEGRVVASRHVKPKEIGAWTGSWSPEDESALDCDPEDPVFPCRVPLRVDGAGLMGWILVGGRPDGSVQGRDEREALAECAGPLARALRAAARQDEERAEKEHLAARVRRLERLLPCPLLPSSSAPL